MGGRKAGGLPHPSISPFPPLPLSIPPKFSDKTVGGKVRSSEGEVPRLPPPYKYQPGSTVVRVNRCAYSLSAKMILIAITIMKHNGWPNYIQRFNC